MQYANETVTKVTVSFVAFFLINEISNHSYCSLRTILLIHIAHHYTKGLCKELESDSQCTKLRGHQILQSLLDAQSHHKTEAI